MAHSQPSTHSAPVRTAQKTRILSPDIARGIALLGIALANVSTAWIVSKPGLPAASIGGIVNDSMVEKIYTVFSAMFIHVRGLPMFSTLLGYGVGMIVLSLWRRGYPDTAARGVLFRRYGFLALFGIIHMVFLFWGDIMFFYGVAGIIFAAMMTMKDKTLWWIAGILMSLHVLINGSLVAFLLFSPGASDVGLSGGLDLTFNSYAETLGFGLLAVPMQFGMVPMEILMLFPLMIVGYIAARHQVLSKVDDFRKPLWISTWVFVAVVVLVGAPWGLAEIGVLPTEQASIFYALNQTLGALSGPGAIAVVALIVQPIQRKINSGEPFKLALPMRMVAALGARSMSGYVAQSILFLLATSSYTLGMGQGGGILAGAAIGLGTWLITVFAAFGLELAGKQGPFESMHRYFAYGKKGLQDPYVPKQLPAAYSQLPGTAPLDKTSEQHAQGN